METGDTTNLDPIHVNFGFEQSLEYDKCPNTCFWRNTWVRGGNFVARASALTALSNIISSSIGIQNTHHKSLYIQLTAPEIELLPKQK